MPNITVHRGDSFAIEIGPVTVTEDDVAEPVDLTADNTKVWFTAKRNATDPDSEAVIRLGSPTTTLTGIALDDPATADKNMATVTVPASATEALTVAKALKLAYDVQLLEPTGRKTTIATGTLTIAADVTSA